MSKIAKIVFCVVVLLLQAGIARADLMAVWDFGDSSSYYTTAATSENVNGTPTLTLAGGELDDNGKDGVAFADAAGNSHVAGQAAAWEDVAISDGDDASWIVTIDTTGWQDLSFYFDYKAWESSTTTLDFDYSLDGGVTWISILDDTTITADKAYHSFSYDLSSITALNNQSSVMLRIDDLDEYGNGKFAFDNLQITGTVVPEPLTLMFLAIGAAGIVRRK